MNWKNFNHELHEPHERKKMRDSFVWFITWLLVVCWVLGGLTGCEQIPGNPAAQAGLEEKGGEKEENQQEQEKEKEQEQEEEEERQEGEEEEKEEEQKEEEERQEEEKEQDQREEENPGPTAKLKGILIGSPPETLFYALGQSFDPSGLIVYGDYDDDTSRVLKANEYTLSRVDTSQAGARQVRVSAGAYTASFPIMVNNSDSILNSISVSAPGGVVRYLGQVLGTEGFTVTGHYTDGDRALSMFSVRGYDRTKRGAQTVTLSVNGQTADLPVRVKVPANAAIKALILGTSPDPLGGHNTAFIKGQSLSLANARFRAAVTCNNVTAVLISGEGITLDDISGFDPNQAGKQTVTLTLDEKSVPLEVYVTNIAPEVYFDYGFMRTATDPDGWGVGSGRTEGDYHIHPGKALVLSPVRVLIGYNADNSDAGVTYSWTVTPRGGSPSLTPSSTNGEFLSLTPAGGGTWDVSVTVTGRNFVDGSTISKTAQTAVICDTGPLPGSDVLRTWRNYAPGQFTESGTGKGWSLGTFGGYFIRSVNHKAQYTIVGNGFDGWAEPGVVWFQEDLNGNNLPDEMWYELNVGSGPTITRRYSITFFKSGQPGVVNEYGQTVKDIYWTDSKGRTGRLVGGWPKDWGVSNDDGAWATYTGTLIYDDGRINREGYSSTWPNCVDTAQTTFPISGAIAADGSAVTLTRVGFLKVHTGVFKYGDVFGEQSTEIVQIDDLQLH